MRNDKRRRAVSPVRPNFHSQSAQQRNSSALCGDAKVFVSHVCVCVGKSVLLNSLTAASCICDSIAQQHSAFVLASHIVMRQVTMKIYPCCRKPHPPKCMQLLVAALRDCDRALRARARDEIIAALISPFGQWHKKGGEGAINFQFYWLHDDYY